MKINFIAGACVLFCVLVTSGCAYNRRAALAHRHAAVMDSLPPIVTTLPIRIVPSFEHRVLAWATKGMMEAHVSYNPNIAESLAPEILAFALIHEYAHLRLDHLPGFGNRPAAAVRQQEIDADCFAARFWATNDARVARAAAESFLSPSARRALGGYPTPKERAQVILDCLAEGSAEISEQIERPIEQPRSPY